MGNSVDTGTPRSVGSRRKDWTSVGENQTIPFQFSFLSDPFAHVVRSLGQDVCPVFEYTGERFS